MADTSNPLRSPGFKPSLLRAAASNPAALKLLADSDALAFQDLLFSLVSPSHQTSIKDKDTLYRSFLSWCRSPALTCPLELRTIVENQRYLKKKHRKAKRNFIGKIGLNLGSAAQQEYISRIDTAAVEQLSAPYPPMSHWIYESDKIKDKWTYWITKGRQADARKKRLPMLRLDPSKLAHNIDAGTSKIFRRAGGSLAGLVIRNFCEDDEVLRWLDSVIKRATSHRRSIRLEDPGSLVQIGYSAGSRSAPAFDWANNLKSKKHSHDEQAEMDIAESSAFALIWNMMWQRLPAEVVGDFDEFVSKTCIKRMDGNRLMVDEEGRSFYSVSVGEDEFDFYDAELAPPTGVFGENYSRAIHYEKQPHRFAASLTVTRSHPASAGGHFFMSNYGIRIAAAPNSLVVWIPSEPHGTSLQNFSPVDKDPGFSQRGLAFVTSSRLPNIWAKYQAEEINGAAALEALQDADDEQFE